MKYIGAIISAISIIVASKFTKSIVNQKNFDKNNVNVIRQPKAYLYIAILGLIIVYVFLPLINLFASESEFHGAEGWVAYFLVISMFDILWIPLLVTYVNWKVEVFDDHIKYRNVFRKTRILPFSEYEVKDHGSALVVVKRIRKKGKYKNKCYLKIFSWSVNYDYLLPKYKAYKKLKNKK